MSAAGAEVPERRSVFREDLLAGQRGPKGGYRLARERRRITVGEIVRIVRDLEGTEDPVSESNGSEIGLKVVRPLWLQAQQEMLQRFDKLTIEQLCDQARKMEIASEAVKVPDFSI